MAGAGADGNRNASQYRPFGLELCQPMASVLPVGERRLRHVAVSWAAPRQATACQYLRNCGAPPQRTRV